MYHGSGLGRGVVVHRNGHSYPPFATRGLGAEEDTGAGATPWIVGGLLLALAVTLFALEKHGPAPIRR